MTLNTKAALDDPKVETLLCLLGGTPNLKLVQLPPFAWKTQVVCSRIGEVVSGYFAEKTSQAGTPAGQLGSLE